MSKRRVLWVVEESGAWGWRFRAAYATRFMARAVWAGTDGIRIVAYVPRVTRRKR